MKNNKSKKIPFKKLAQKKHVRFKMNLEQEALDAFYEVSDAFLKDVLNTLKERKLAKSDAKGALPGI